MQVNSNEVEVTLTQKTHCSVERISEGSIIILLQTETSDAVGKLIQFIESGDISKFLKQLFQTNAGWRLPKKDTYEIEIEIRTVQTTATGKTCKKITFLIINHVFFLSVKIRCHVLISSDIYLQI